LKLFPALWGIVAVVILILVWPDAQAAWATNQAGLQVLQATGAVISAGDAMTTITECRPRLYSSESATWQDALAPMVTAWRSTALPATPSRATFYASLAWLSGDATLTRLARQDLSTGGQRQPILAWTLGCALGSQGDETAAINVWAEAGLASALAMHGEWAQVVTRDSAWAGRQFTRAAEVYQRNPTWMINAITPAATFAQSANYYSGEHDMASAVVMWKQALTLDPNAVEYYRALASQLKPEEAMAVFEQGVATVTGDSRRGELLGFWGSYLVYQGRYVEAWARFQEAFSANPQSREWEYWAPDMVQLAIKAGRLEALRDQMLAVDRAGGNPASRAILKAIEQVKENRP